MLTYGSNSTLLIYNPCYRIEIFVKKMFPVNKGKLKKIMELLTDNDEQFNMNVICRNLLSDLAMMYSEANDKGERAKCRYLENNIKVITDYMIDDPMRGYNK